MLHDDDLKKLAAKVRWVRVARPGMAAPPAAVVNLNQAARNAANANAALISAKNKARKAGNAALKATGDKPGMFSGAKEWLGERAVNAAAKPLETAIFGVGAAGIGALAKLRKRSVLQRMGDSVSPMFGTGSPGRKALAFGAGAGAIGLGIEGASSLHDAIADPLRRRKYMKNMLEDNPQLKRENPKEVGRAFNTLYTFNKRMASDPLVAGSFLRRALQFREEGVQPVDIKTLVDAHPKSGDPSRFKDILPSTAKDLMSFVSMSGGGG